MNRRNFLSLMVGGVAVAAARTFPFQVFSFPRALHCANLAPGGHGIAISADIGYGESIIFTNRGSIWRYPGAVCLSREISIEDAQRMFPPGYQTHRHLSGYELVASPPPHFTSPSRTPA